MCWLLVIIVKLLCKFALEYDTKTRIMLHVRAWMYNKDNNCAREVFLILIVKQLNYNQLCFKNIKTRSNVIIKHWKNVDNIMDHEYKLIADQYAH